MRRRRLRLRAQWGTCSSFGISGSAARDQKIVRVNVTDGTIRKNRIDTKDGEFPHAARHRILFQESVAWISLSYLASV
jgi:hypothetical protein